jgi:signal transduction histidine kinase
MQRRFQFHNKLDPDTLANLDLAFRLTHTLEAMISSLLDISKLEAGKMSLNLQPGDLRTVAQEVLQTLGPQEERARVSLNESSEAVGASFDRDVIQRVIGNLVGNAIKFTPREGKISITVKGEGDQALVAVSDTGPGIPSEYHEKIFEKFGQVEAAQAGQKRSTGLGLTFCKLAVEAHGGKIRVESRVGEGSTFRFYLPAAKNPPGPDGKEK